MLANTHRRHLISNRLALATGFILLLAQTGAFTPGEDPDHAYDVEKTSVVNKAEASRSTNNVLLDLGLLLISN